MKIFMTSRQIDRAMQTLDIKYPRDEFIIRWNILEIKPLDIMSEVEPLKTIKPEIKENDDVLGTRNYLQYIAYNNGGIK